MAAKEHHPDAGGDAESFALVAWAYEILKDPEAKAYYDQTGQTKDREPDATSKLAGIIVMLWEAVLQEPGKAEHKDLISRMSKSARENVKVLKQNIAANFAMRKDLKAMEKRLSYSGESINPLGHWLTRNLDMSKFQILQMREEQLLYRQVLQHLKDYSWQWEEQAPKPMQDMWTQAAWEENPYSQVNPNYYDPRAPRR